MASRQFSSTSFRIGTTFAVVGLLALASCGGDDSASSADTSVSSTEAIATTEAPVTETNAPEPTDAPVVAPTWETVDAPSDCMCADGSAFHFYVREASPTKVLFYLEGGGACFSAEMCKPGSGTYSETISPVSKLEDSPGIFDFANPENPFADYSVVYVPYCTGDVHAGNTTKDYGNGVVTQHKGFVNASNALDTMIERFPDTTQLVVAGSSAGSFPTPVFAALAGDQLPNADLKVFADSSGAIPDAMGFVIGNWGTLETLPDWPELVGVTVDQFTPAYTFIKAAEHNPKIRFARHDFAFDSVLSSFARMAGLSPDDLVSVMRTNEAKVEATGVNVANWISPGDDHTIAVRDEFYTEEMNGVRFVDWFTAFMNDSPEADNYCVDCAG
ncbi:MAG: hypothetical protein F2780_02255 [Actinobacteria bacterium]|uniref:Unannotated protein n=1 Tax=freshwater metagenome TaxID=449393 RepID=A0A6J7CR36_9ZZZZ|nr:hypothetical protein [Actinomycetota bacterium]